MSSLACRREAERLRDMGEVHRYLVMTRLEMEVDLFTFEKWLKVRDEFKVTPKSIKVN